MLWKDIYDLNNLPTVLKNWASWFLQIFIDAWKQFVKNIKMLFENIV